MEHCGIAFVITDNLQACAQKVSAVRCIDIGRNRKNEALLRFSKKDEDKTGLIEIKNILK